VSGWKGNGLFRAHFLLRIHLEGRGGGRRGEPHHHQPTTNSVGQNNNNNTAPNMGPFGGGGTKGRMKMRVRTTFFGEDKGMGLGMDGIWEVVEEGKAISIRGPSTLCNPPSSQQQTRGRKEGKPR
jgi:hypothetical protein